MVERSSPWAMAPDRDVQLGTPMAKLKLSSTGDADAAASDPEATFSPKLMSSQAIRDNAKSAGYGVDEVPKKAAPNVPSTEDRRMVGATFKPNLSYGKKMRQNAASNGYGKVVPQKKVNREPEQHTFTPNTALSRGAARMKEQAASSSYGKVAASNPAAKHDVDMKGAKHGTFQPDLDQFGAAGAKIRASAPSGSYLQPRPATAPTTKPSGPQVLRHTLAADKGREEPIPENKDIGPGFELARLVQDLTDPSSKATIPGTFPPPPPPPESAHSKQIKDNAQSSGYSNPDYEPLAVKVEAKQSEQVMAFGVATTTYVDSPDKLPKFEPSHHHKMVSERAASAGYASRSYTPDQGQRKQVESAPTFSVSLKSCPPPAVEALAPIVTRASKQVQSSGYGVVSPAVGQKKQLNYYSPTASPTRPRVDKSIAANGGVEAEAEEDEGGELTEMPLNESMDEDAPSGEVDEY